MFGNTVTVRAFTPALNIPVIAAGGVGTFTEPLAGLVPGDSIVPFPANTGGINVMITGACSVAGTLDVTAFNVGAAPTIGAAAGPFPVTILKNTGSV
jgi:hypothetical protein